MAVKIQIASLEALERLLAGDTELEIEIRNSIIQNFSNKHLKGIANEYLKKGVGEYVKTLMTDAEIIKEIGTGYSKTIQLTEKTRELIKNRTENTIYEKIHDKIDEAIKASPSYKELETTLNRACERISQDLTDINLNKRIDALVDKRIKERMGLS